MNDLKDPSSSEAQKPSTGRMHNHLMEPMDPDVRKVWHQVAHSPLKNLWNFEGTPPLTVLKRSATAFIDDNLVSRAAELGYYFLFALFPTLVTASSILGLVAKRASTVYVGMLDYLSIVIPHGAFQIVVDTFNQTTAASSGGKITFGLVLSLWSASVGFAAIQDTANIVYKVKETRPYWKSKLQAILVTILLSVVITLTLGVLLGADFLTTHLGYVNHNKTMIAGEIWLIHIASWILVFALLMLLFALIYYYAPDLKTKTWHWLTPGATFGILGWFAASLGFRAYLHYFPSYSTTYGSLGAVIVLLTWFYVTGLMLLAGAEINSEIQAAIIEKRLKAEGKISSDTAAEPSHPMPLAS